jgi:uracil phosphoribosyltransferase
MPLNIYTINHPLVRNWSSYICNVNLSFNDKKETLNQLYLSLLYEATRKSIKTIDLYLHKLKHSSEISLLCNKGKSLIFSEINLVQILGKNLYQIIPDSLIWPFHINNHQVSKKQNISFFNSLIPKQFHYQIVILETYLHYETVHYIFNLINTENITTDKILIICLICSTDTLQIIKKNYTNINLTIYTTKIIENNDHKEIKSLLRTSIV